MSNYPGYPPQPGAGGGAPYPPAPGAPGGAPGGSPYPPAAGPGGAAPPELGFSMSLPPMQPGGAPGGSPYPPAPGASPYPPAAGGSPYPPAAGGSPYPPAAGGSPYPPAAGGGYPPPAQHSMAPGGYPPAGGAGMAPAAGYPGYPSQAAAAHPGQHHPQGMAGAAQAGRYQLSVACKKLKDLDVMSKSDPVCVLYKQEAGGWREVGRTEQIKNNLNPSWQKKFTVDHPSPDGRATNLRFEVYDWDSKSNKLKAHDFLARLEVSMDKILSTPGMHFVTVMSSGPSKGGHFIVTAERLGGGGAAAGHHTGAAAHGGGGKDQSGANSVRIKFAARNLDKKDTFGKSDPYFVINRMTGAGQLTPVHRSEVIKNNLNPQWQPFTISVQQLCGGKMSATLKIDVFDHDGSGAADLIGSFQTSLTQLSQGVSQGKRFPLINPKKTSKRGYRDSGEVYIQDFKLY